MAPTDFSGDEVERGDVSFAFGDDEQPREAGSIDDGAGGHSADTCGEADAGGDLAGLELEEADGSVGREADDASWGGDGDAFLHGGAPADGT